MFCYLLIVFKLIVFCILNIIFYLMLYYKNRQNHVYPPSTIYFLMRERESEFNEIVCIAPFLSVILAQET